MADLKREVEGIKSELSQYRALTITSRLRVKELKKEVDKLKSELSRSNMQRRQSRRFMVSLVAEIFFEGKSYEGLIENISDNGVQIRIAPIKNPVDFVRGQTLNVKLRLPSGETLNPVGNAIWSYKTPPYRMINCLGIEIIETDSNYKAFLKTLQEQFGARGGS